MQAYVTSKTVVRFARLAHEGLDLCLGRLLSHLMLNLPTLIWFDNHVVGISFFASSSASACS